MSSPSFEEKRPPALRLATTVQAHSDFSEEELHQTARMIVAALQARIHTVEWTPALLNNKVLNISMHNNWCVCSRSADTIEKMHSRV